jgi:hypothetical protein
VTHPPLQTRLTRAHDAVRRALMLRHALRGAAALCALVALLVLAAVPLELGPRAAWVRSALGAALALAVVARALASVRAALPRFDAWLEGLEARFPDTRSWLRNALDLERTPPVHGSAELAGALRDEAARRLARVPLAAETPSLRARGPALAIAAALLALATVGALAPRRTAGSWAALWDPASAAPPVRLVVEPGSVRVAPGSALAVRARVWGSGAVPRLERDGGPAVAAVAEAPGADGAKVWRFDLAMITREERYRVRAARAVSPRYRIALAGEPAPVSFEITYTAPAYARLPVQRGTATRGDLEALRGTVARVVVTFDRDLDALEATPPSGARAAWTAITARRWSGTLTLDRAGEWTLAARAAAGGATLRYRVTPLDDTAPLLSVVTPDGDVDLPAGQRIPLEVLGQDDLGLSELALQYRAGDEGAWRTLSLQRFAQRPREARVRSEWDATPLGLLPGGSATFRFVLWDDDAVSGRKAATSRPFTLRFPSLAELYQDLDQRQGGVQQSLEQVTDQARDLQKSLEKMARTTPPTRPTPPGGSSFERREEMRSALERQQELTRRVNEAAAELRQTLEDAAERSAFDDTLMRKLAELNELMRQIESPELRQAVERMRQAMERLDPRAAEQEIKPWRDASKEMLENLERTLALLQKLRAEERLDALAKKADELAQRQDALNREHDAPPPSDAAARAERAAQLASQQREAAARARELANETRETAREQASEESAELQQAAEQLEQQAAPQQDEAAEAQSRQQGSRARSAGERASRSLQQAAQRLSQSAQRAREGREGADLAAVRRAAQDLLSVERATQSNLDSPADPRERADQQTDLSEGVARVADSLYTLARRSPFITPRLAEQLGRARQQLAQSGRELARGDRQRGDQAGREGGAALNQAVRELRLAESSMCQQPGQGQPGGQNGSQAMGELGERQSQLNQRSRAMAQRLSQQMRLSAGDQSEMRRMAAEQQRLREELERIQQQDERERHLLGRLEGARRDMQEAEEALRAGTPGAELERVQERILSRLLDAQRSVNRRDFDPTRESRPGAEVPRPSPAALSAERLRESDRLRLGLLKADSDRYPARYRAFVEAYLRALSGTAR